MEDVERLLKTSMSEIERLLNTNTVVGEPITADGNTIIPLVRFGFVFGAGGGMGKEKGEKGEGTGLGSGGGGGIRPVACIIAGKDTVTVTPIMGGTGTALDRVGDAVGRILEHRVQQKKEE